MAGGVNVPFLAFGPDIPVGRTDALVSVFDVFPTIAAWARVDVAVDGVSLAPILVDPDASIRDAVLLERFEGEVPDEVRSAFVTRDYKLIRKPEREELYRYDLGELDDLVDDPAAQPVLDELRARMDAAIAGLE